MRFGRQPVISETAVQAILDSLFFSTENSDDATPLQYLFLVEKKLIDPKTPRSENQRFYSIQLILIEIISTEMEKLRNRFGKSFERNETYQDVLLSLASDSKIQSNELVCWSILFYFYAQIDLGLSIDSIAAVIGVTSRTVRHYRKHGVKLLAQKLWEAEAECRQKYHYECIYSRLEPWDMESFVGREQEIQTVINSIVNSKRNLIYIHGDKGIGKSSFIRAVISRLMDQFQIDELLWLSNFDGNEIAQIRKHFIKSNSDISIQTVFRLFKCVIVLDDVDDLLKSSAFENLLDLLDGAIVFFSSTEYYSVTMPTLQVRLSNFDSHTVEEVIKSTWVEVHHDVVERIRDLSNGNPHKLIYLINYHKYSLSSESQVALVSGLKLSQRILLLIIPSQDGLLTEDVNLICDILQIGDDDIDFLQDLKFITRSESRIYGQVKPEIISNTVVEIRDHIRDIVDRLSAFIEPWIICAHVITTYSKHLDDELTLIMIERCWRTGLLNGNTVTWYSLLLEVPQTELWIGLAKAVSHKEMNQLALAESMLLELLSVSGYNGDFRSQAEITLELVKVYRLQARYNRAVHHLNIIEQSLKTYFKATEYKTLLLEQAQLALDMDQLDYAIALVTPLNSPEAVLIQAEAFYRLNNIQACLRLCHDLLASVSLSHMLRGIIHNLIGRCHQESNYKLAANEFDLAIEYLRYTFNIRHLSHAQINLATAFIHLEDVDEAIQLLKYAEKVCQITDDKVGMKIIHNNKAYLHRLITSRY